MGEQQVAQPHARIETRFGSWRAFVGLSSIAQSGSPRFIGRMPLHATQTRCGSRLRSAQSTPPTLISSHDPDCLKVVAHSRLGSIEIVEQHPQPFLEVQPLRFEILTSPGRP